MRYLILIALAMAMTLVAPAAMAEDVVVFDLEIFENGSLVSTPTVASGLDELGRSDRATVRVGNTEGELAEIWLSTKGIKDDRYSISVIGSYGPKSDMKVVKAVNYMLDWKEPLLFVYRRSDAAPEIAVRVSARLEDLEAIQSE